MSILSSTQGTPERVWSLISLLATHDGKLDRDQAYSWLNPVASPSNITKDKSVAFDQALGAATSLGAVSSNKDVLALDATCRPRTYAEFCDWVHERLAGLVRTDKDAVIFETYAFIVARSQQDGSLAWLSKLSGQEFADTSNQTLGTTTDDDGLPRINNTKLPSWRRWLVALGLMQQLPVQLPGSGNPYPWPYLRIERELQNLDLPTGTAIPAPDFIRALGRRMPYLDGGHIYYQALARLSHNPNNQTFSPLMSSALRALHDNGVLMLKLPGDATNVFRLSRDPQHALQAVHTIVLPAGERK